MKTLKYLLLVSVCLVMQNLHSQNVDIALAAFELRMNGHPYEALALLDSALQLYPDSSRLWFEKGRCIDWITTDDCTKFLHLYSKLAPRVRKSRKCFSRAYHLDSDNARYYYWASQIVAIEALECIYTPWKWPLVPIKSRKSASLSRKAVIYAPDDAFIRYSCIEYSRFGWLLSMSRKELYAHLDTLEMLDPVYAVKARQELATTKKPYDVLQGYKSLEQSYPHHQVLLEGLTREYAKLIPKDSAYADTTLAYMQRLMDADPQNPSNINRIVVILNRHKIDDPIDWIENYLTAVEDEYGFYRSVGLTLLGREFEKKGDTERSNECFREAEQLNPDKLSSYFQDFTKP
jgi:tetratricopeptide (TPR) repeat protein